MKRDLPVKIEFAIVMILTLIGMGWAVADWLIRLLT